MQRHKVRVCCQILLACLENPALFVQLPPNRSFTSLKGQAARPSQRWHIQKPGAGVTLSKADLISCLSPLGSTSHSNPIAAGLHIYWPGLETFWQPICEEQPPYALLIAPDARIV